MNTSIYKWQRRRVRALRIAALLACAALGANAAQGNFSAVAGWLCAAMAWLVAGNEAKSFNDFFLKATRWRVRCMHFVRTVNRLMWR